MRQVLLYTFLATGACSCLSPAAISDEPADDSSVTVELKLSLEEFDPASPSGTLTCIVHNESDHEVSIPSGFNSDQTRVYGKVILEGDPANLMTRWPLKLYRRDGVASSTELITLKAGKQAQVFELQLAEILEARIDEPLDSDEASTASAKRATDDAHQESSWGWDWIARPRAPQSPIHSHEGLLAAAEFWVELDIGDRRLASKPQRLRIRQTTSKEKVIWETRGGGQVEFTITPDENGYLFHVTSYNFAQKDLHFRLTSNDAKPFELVEKMLAERDVPHFIPKPGAASGSSTTITIVNAEGEGVVIKNAMSWHDDLRPISRFVAETIEKAQQKQ